jgi:hypothetical protein
MELKMATKYPPRLSLDESVRVIKDIYNTHKSKEISEDLMPQILKTAQTSSFFVEKINALQKFGFVEKKPNKVLELTDLAMKIVTPIGDEDVEAKNIAFQKEDVLAGLLEKYPNGNLPSTEQLQQTLMKSFNIPRETVKKWSQFVIDSFKEISFNNASTLNTEPTQIVAKTNPSTFTATQNLVLPSGKKFSFSLEDGLTLDDLDFITDFFELKKKRL